MTDNQQPVNGEDTSDFTYFEVDIEYSTQAKMVLLGKNEEDISNVVLTGLDIPGVRILSISPANEELVKEAKARRAFEEASIEDAKKQMN